VNAERDTLTDELLEAKRQVATLTGRLAGISQELTTLKTQRDEAAAAAAATDGDEMRLIKSKMTRMRDNEGR
jgi:hypothetical protein